MTGARDRLRIAGRALNLLMATILVGCVAARGPDSAGAPSLAARLKKVVPGSHWPAVSFLVSNMPERDREGLTVEFLAENIDYAYRAREKFCWGKAVPEDIFLNCVLPYASLNEQRDAWRRTFFERFADMVSDCKTAGEAAIKLNKGIYDDLDVHYSKERPKPDQSSFESMKAGKASCTGLSILLVDACRAVGIPARIAGTPRWVGGDGNHTWVEVWDDGWHSIGASESRELDRTWFSKRAAGQVEGDPVHAIYATSFKKTGLHFPLIWNTSVKYVSAIDVTSRYAEEPERAVSLAEVQKVMSGSDMAGLLARLEKRDMFIRLADCEKIEKLAWQKYSDEVRADEKRLKEHGSKSITYDGMTMRYAYKRVGEKPEGGYPLYIAMHGGGGAPARVNDSQWQHMKAYYLNGVKKGIYLAPRGVNNAWNLHWVRQSFACYDRIIENMIVFEGVDPNRVYLMGYSAGGDASYQVPARMPDRWAGVAMSAGHPNGVSPVNYAALAFLIQVGEKDSAYKRNKVGAEYGLKLDKLEGEHPGLYEHATRIHAGRGHGFMDHGPEGSKQKVYSDIGAWLKSGAAASAETVDCNSIRWLDQHVRDPLPDKVIWDCKTSCDRSGAKEQGFWLTAEKGKLHYWLGIDRYSKDPELDVGRIVVDLDRDRNRVNVSEVGNYVNLYFRPDMIDLSRDIVVVVQGQELKKRAKLSLRVLVRSLLDRGDPNYIFPARLTLSRNPEGTWLLE